MPRLKHIRLPPGTMLTERYRIEERLGAGWEGEVYKVLELVPGIERTAKLFLPHRNIRNRTLKFYARKLHKLRQCPLVIQYHSHDRFIWRDVEIDFLVSEFIEGELLSSYVQRQHGKRLPLFRQYTSFTHLRPESSAFMPWVNTTATSMKTTLSSSAPA